METQQDLNKWIIKCIEYYNNHSLTKIEYMKTIDQRVEQLEQAHSRLFNLFNSFQKDFEQNKQVQTEQVELLKDLINSLQPKEEEYKLLPDNLYAGTEYKAVIAGIVKATPTVWKEMEYCNWEVKLEGKPDYVYVAFIPQTVQLQVGDAVRFTYAHPFQLRKLKQI